MMARRNVEIYEITLGEHRHHLTRYLGFRGTPTDIDIDRVVATGILPVMDIGIAGRVGGQIGAGVIRAPMECFEHAVELLGG